MIIQHNIQSIYANRMTGITTSMQGKSAEKLSSGYTINRAADDAAGLAISEKMRKQIRGLDRASTNSMDGISMVQTAEGALTEVHDMLHRMNELSVQAANGTNSETDREAIQNEIDQLVTEIDRVSESTKFNETYLLKGGSGEKTHYLNIHDAGLKGIVNNSTDGSAHGSFTMDRLNFADEIMVANQKYTIGIGKADVQSIINESGEPGDTVVIDGTETYHIIDSNNGAPFEQTSKIVGTVTESTNNVSIGSNNYELKSGNAIAEYADRVAGSINANTTAVTISGDSNGKNGTYTLIDGSGNVAERASNIASKINDSTYSVSIGGSSYTIKTSDGYTAASKTTIANAITNASTVKVGNTNYVLRNAGKIASTKDEINEYLQDRNPSSVTVVNGGSSTVYTIGNGAGDKTIDEVKTIISGLTADSGNTVSFGGTTYDVKSYSANTIKNSINSGYADDTKIQINNSSSQKYLLKTNYKSLSTLRSEVTSAGTGTNVTITSSNNTQGYTVRDYNYNDVKNYVGGASVGGGTSATTSVSVVNSGNTSNYKLRNYNLASVKNEIANLEYDDSTLTGTLISVDGNSYTAETRYFRSAICIAYGEDNRTDVTSPGVSEDDPISDRCTVTFHGKTYSLIKDEDGDGYDDEDNSIVTESRAYKIIAKELERASSIGALDTRAHVRDKNNEDIVDDVTMAADFLEDADNENSRVRFEIDRGTITTAKELQVGIHAGSDADMNNKIGVGIEAMSAARLGIAGLNVCDSNGMMATYAIDAIEDAIKEVSRQRSLLGAVQNRMEHTIKNLDNVVENTTSAESRIRDTDMAEEMVKYSKNNILVQAGNTMLAQANQSKQGVMTLLQG